MKRRVGALVLAGLLSVLAACGEDGAAAGEDPAVVAAFYPLEFVAQRVAGRHAAVDTLTQPGQHSHDAELTISQTAAMTEADVVVHLSGYQPMVDEAIPQGEALVVDAAEVVELLPVAEDSDTDHEETHDEGDEGDEHGHEGLDLHFWTDPTRLAEVAGPVATALSEVDPDHAETYQDNAEALRQDLRALDRELTRGLATCERDTLVVSHDAFGYLGERYGLEIHAVAGRSPDAEPSPARLRELHDLIRRDGVTTVFSEPLSGDTMAETLASDLGLETAVLDPVEGLRGGDATDDYLSLMRDNLTALRAANGCR